MLMHHGTTDHFDNNYWAEVKPPPTNCFHQSEQN
jgi:hypothetical protein